MESAVAAQPDGNMTLNLATSVEARIKIIEDKFNNLDVIMEAKMKTMTFMNDNTKSSNDFFKKPILERKAVSDIDKMSDAKSYRPFNRKLKNAMEQTRLYARKVMEMLESISEQEIIDSSTRDPKP